MRAETIMAIYYVLENDIMHKRIELEAVEEEFTEKYNTENFYDCLRTDETKLYEMLQNDYQKAKAVFHEFNMHDWR